MAYIEIDIDIEDHLGEVDTIELVKELERRKGDKKDILAALGARSVRDVSKLEAFLEKYKDVPETELDNFLSNY